MKKKIISILTAVTIMSTFFTGCGSSGTESADAEVWNIAVIQTEDHPETQALIKMGEIFSDLTDGRYRFEVFPNELLGPQRETLEQVQYGIIEMAVIGNPNISSFVDGFLAFEMPYVFDDEDHQKRFFESSPAVDELYKETEQYNFKIAANFTAGTRNMYASKPIEKVSDLKSMKIRTAESDTYAKMMKCFGGAATPMSMGEVFTAIQSGVVDGAENNEASYASTKHYEIANYYSYTKHLIVPDYLIINTDLYNNLSDADKEAFDKAAKLAAEYEYELWDKETEKYKEEAVAPLHEELCQNPEIDKIYKAVKECSNK